MLPSATRSVARPVMMNYQIADSLPFVGQLGEHEGLL